MSDESVPTEPTQRIERGALTGSGLTEIAPTVSMAANVVPVVKAGVDVGAHVYELLHPPKPEAVKPILPPGVSKD